MITSAASLHSALTAVHSFGKGGTFADAVLRAVGNPDGNKSESFRLMSDLYLDLKADIEVAFSDKLLASLQRTAAPFSALLKFSTYDQSVHNLSNSPGNFLHLSMVDSLLMLDAALQGKCERPAINYDEEISKAFVDLRNVMAELSLPESLKSLIEKRISQLERAARDFSFYGINGLTRSIEELVGAIEVHVEPKVSQKSKSYKKYRQALVGTILTVTGAVATTNAAVSEVKELADHVGETIELLPNFSDSKISENEKAND